MKIQWIFIFQWIFLALLSGSLVVFVTRPSLFLLAGLGSGTGLQPHAGYRVLSYIFISSKLILIYLILIYNTYRTKSPFGSFMFSCTLIVSILSGLGLFICCTVSAATCNEPNVPNNPCNSEFICCYLSSVMPACGLVPDYCNTPPAMSNPRVGPLKANSMFVEYFVWIGVFLILDAIQGTIQYYIFKQRQHLPEESTGSESPFRTQSKFPTLSGAVTTMWGWSGASDFLKKKD